MVMRMKSTNGRGDLIKKKRIAAAVAQHRAGERSGRESVRVCEKLKRLMSLHPIIVDGGYLPVVTTSGKYAEGEFAVPMTQCFVV